MAKVLKNIYSIEYSEEKNETLKSWMLECNEGIIIIDTGLKQDPAFNGITSELQSISKKLDYVKLILITHKHGDHIGNLAQIERFSDAPVRSHLLETAVITYTKARL